MRRYYGACSRRNSWSHCSLSSRHVTALLTLSLILVGVLVLTLPGEIIFARLSLIVCFFSVVDLPVLQILTRVRIICEDALSSSLYTCLPSLLVFISFHFALSAFSVS